MGVDRAARRRSAQQRRNAPTADDIATRALDMLGAGLLIALLSPLWLAIAAAIILTSGRPVFFRQERVGRGGRHFNILKFRTMVPGAAEDLHKDHWQQLASQDDAPIRLENDPRVTAVGRHLRRWSLDELPNLWNVLVGEMSMVGPRPLVPYEFELLSEHERRRSKVRPGITGLAQIKGRLDLSARQRSHLDVEYVERRSVWLDVRILALTVPAVLRNKGT